MTHETLDVRLLSRRFRGRIAITWLLVLAENTLLALIPLFLGRAIDTLLGLRKGGLWEVATVMGALILVSVGRRLYDTRAYGSMRVWFGSEVVQRLGNRPVSQVNARLDMGREMVDFLEGYVPQLLTSLVQIVVSLLILWEFGPFLGVNGLIVILVFVLIYAAFHGRFYQLNRDLNAQVEEQVQVLEMRDQASLLSHLKRLRRFEVGVSDTDAFLYGAIYVALFAFVLANLWVAARIPDVTPGAVFAILSYSWEVAESGIALPMVLQQWTRLREIRERLNEPPHEST